jgi:hypothetical protein
MMQSSLFQIHIIVVGRNLLMQPLRSVRQQVAVLVHSSALHQCVRPDQAERLLQPGRIAWALVTRARPRASSNSAATRFSMNPRTRSRIAVSIGSNHPPLSNPEDLAPGSLLSFSLV